MVRQPGRTRIDSPSTGVSSITDLNTGQCVWLFHKLKAVSPASPQQGKSVAGPSPFSMLGRPVENLWNLKDGTEKSLGEREVDGQPAVGFEVRQNTTGCDCRIVVWAGKDSGRPIRVETTLQNPQNDSQSVTIVLNHFNLDAELDEGLFSLEPPPGYTLAYQKTLDETVTNSAVTPEGEKIEQALQLWSDGNKGKAIATLVSVDWTKAITFSPRGYLFAMTEKEFVALKRDDQTRVISEVSKAATPLRTRQSALGFGTRRPREARLRTAEARLTAVLSLGNMFGNNQDRLLTLQMVGHAIQKKTLEELKLLYQETNRQADLARVEEQTKAVDALREALRQRIRGQ